jgi:hypothetical protein
MVGVYMQAASMTVEQYEQIDAKLRESTGPVPAGLILHTVFKEGDNLGIFDVWESEEAFTSMGPVLMPIVAELGAELSPPQFSEMVAYEAH